MPSLLCVNQQIRYDSHLSCVNFTPNLPIECGLCAAQVKLVTFAEMKPSPRLERTPLDLSTRAPTQTTAPVEVLLGARDSVTPRGQSHIPWRAPYACCLSHPDRTCACLGPAAQQLHSDPSSTFLLCFSSPIYNILSIFALHFRVTPLWGRFYVLRFGKVATTSARCTHYAGHPTGRLIFC